MSPVTLGAGWPRNESRREGLEPRSGDQHDRRAALKDVLDQAGSLPLPAALLMFDDVLEALEKKQATGAVHGEVALSGISVDEFGHCHLRTDDEHSAAYVAGRGGTHRYAAPEVRRGGSVTATADAYAATAVFAEAVTGLPPDVARDVITTDSAGSTTVPENPVPSSVRRLVDIGMAADEARRPSNAGALRDALNTASTAAFPMADWRARGRAWLAAAAPKAAPEGRAAPVAVAMPFRIPNVPAPVANFGARIPTSASTAAASVVPVPTAAPGVFGAATGAAAAAAATTAGASTAAGAAVPAPLPWQSQVPSYVPAERPRYDWEDGRLPPLPGFFRRLGRGDPGIVSGCGISVIGFVLLVIGASVGLSLSGPNNASASQPTPAISAPDDSSNGAAGATPPAVGSSPGPGLAGSEQVSPSPGTSSSASPSAQPSPSPTDTGAPSFTPYPTFTPAPTPTPTPQSCFLICPNG